MPRRELLVLAAVLGTGTLLRPPSAAPVPALSPPPSRSAPAPFDADRQIFTFEHNEGQLPEDLAWAARGAPHGVGIDRSGEPVLGLSTPEGPRVLHPRFSQATAPDSEGLEPAHMIAVYKGRPEDWKPALSTFRRVRVQGVRPGVDVDYYGSADGRLEYDLRLAPGADPADLALTFDGADGSRIDQDGALVHRLGTAELRQAPPKAWTESEGGPEAVVVHWSERGDGRFGFDLGSYDSDRTLVIDPEFLWATWFGGTAGEQGRDLQLDGQGGAWLVGGSAATDLTAFDAQTAEDLPGTDAFAAHFGSDGQIMQAIWLGGEESDWASTIAVGEDGSFWLVGMTTSPGPADVQSWETDVVFPVSAGAQQDWNDRSLFAAYFSASGSLVASTMIGRDFDGLNSVARMEPSGALVVAGTALEADVPDANDTDWMDDKPYFSLNVATDGDLITSATAPYGMNDEGGLAFAPDGDVLVWGGDFTCTTFPDAWEPDGNPTAQGLSCLRKFSTFTMTQSWEVSLGYGAINAIAFDGDENILVTGVTWAAVGFYTTEGPPPAAGTEDIPFIAKLGPGGTPAFSKRWWPTEVPDAWPTAAAFDAAGNIYIGGGATEDSLMEVHPLYVYGGGESDPFLVKLDPEAEDVFLATFLGGSAGNQTYLWIDAVDELAVDDAGTIWLLNSGFSLDMPTTTQTQQGTPLGTADLWLAAVRSTDPPVAPPHIEVALELTQELEDSDDDPASRVTIDLLVDNQGADVIDRVGVSYALSEPVEAATLPLDGECAWDSVDANSWGSIIICDYEVDIASGAQERFVLTVRAAMHAYVNERLGQRRSWTCTGTAA